MAQRPDYRNYEPHHGPTAWWELALFAFGLTAPFVALVLSGLGVL